MSRMHSKRTTYEITPEKATRFGAPMRGLARGSQALSNRGERDRLLPVTLQLRLLSSD
jgi:hypothetical protein